MNTLSGLFRRMTGNTIPSDSKCSMREDAPSCSMPQKKAIVSSPVRAIMRPVPRTSFRFAETPARIGRRMFRMISLNARIRPGYFMLLPAMALFHFFLSSSVACAQDAAPPAQSAAQVQFAQGGNVAQIPVEITGNLVFIPAGVNDAQPSWFLLDTARPSSAFDDIRAASLNLLPASTGAARVTELTNAVLDFPGLKVSVPSLALVSLDDVSSRVGRAVQGVLGADVLGHFVVVLDYERSTLQFYDPKSYHYTGKGEKLKWTLPDGVPAVSGRVEIRGRGKIDGVFRISTGEPEPIVFSAS